MTASQQENPIGRKHALAMSPKAFEEVGIMLVNQIARFLEEIAQKPVTTGETPQAIKAILGNSPLPTEGQPIQKIMEDATQLLIDHSLFNGHPRFWGYITSSAAPSGALADMLSSAINPNVGAFSLSPIATEIEKQTIQWLGEFIGYEQNSHGLFVSGGNMANFIGFLAARQAKHPGNIRQHGINDRLRNPASGAWGTYLGNSPINQKRQLIVYCSEGTHTWVQKAANLFGHGTDSIRWIEVNKNHQMDIEKLQYQLKLDLHQGHIPFLVIGNAGSVSTGSVDSLEEISRICKTYNLWFHIDGAYGAPAAALPEMAPLFEGLKKADSIAIDPHKWLYSPLEAGCILVRDEKLLRDTFSFHPEYYNFDGYGGDAPTNFFDYGFQNSRGFRAFKVWVGLKQVGKNGYVEMIREDISLAQNLFELLNTYPELQPISQNLSITTFRYKPMHFNDRDSEKHLNKLNEILLNRLQAGGEIYLSNAVIDGKYCLRTCFVNFRTQLSDVMAIPEIVIKEGKIAEAHMELRSKELFNLPH